MAATPPGREIVQYAARFGQKGWLAVAVIFVGFSITCGLAFELARQASAYDYKAWSREIVGGGWILVDLLMLSILILVIAVMSAAIGEVLQQTLGMPPLLGLVIAVGTVGLLTWKGSEFIERVKTVGSIALYIAYISFAVLVLSDPQIAAQADPTAVPPPTADAFSPGASWLEVVWTGALYIGYNFSVVLAVLFCLHRQTTRSGDLQLRPALGCGHDRALRADLRLHDALLAEPGGLRRHGPLAADADRGRRVPGRRRTLDRHLRSRRRLDPARDRGRQHPRSGRPHLA